MKKKALLALDYGSQSVKCISFSENGELLGTESEAYPWISPRTGFIEVDPVLAFNKAVETVRRTVAKLPDYEFVAMSFSYFGHGMMLVDENYEPLTNIILLSDRRTEDVKAELIAKGADKVYEEENCSPFMSICIPAKVYWIKKYQPEIYNKAAYLSDLQMYTLAKLGVEVVNDGSMAQCKSIFNPRTHELSKKMLEAFEVPESWVQDHYAHADHLCGTITKFGDVELGCSCMIMPGAHDTECGVLGLGAIPEFPGVLSNSMGTYQQCGFLYTPNEKYIAEKGRPFFITKGGEYFCTANATASSGSAMSWFIRTFCNGENIYDELFEKCKFDGTNKVLFVNDLSDSRGSICGMDLTTTREDIFEAMIEGIALNMAPGYEKVENRMQELNGCSIKEMRVMGGSSQADKFLQLLADVNNMSVVRSSHIQGTGCGAAMIAGVGSGVFEDYKVATEKMVILTDRFEPRAEYHNKYMEKLETFHAYKQKMLNK